MELMEADGVLRKVSGKDEYRVYSPRWPVTQYDEPPTTYAQSEPHLPMQDDLPVDPDTRAKQQRQRPILPDNSKRTVWDSVYVQDPASDPSAPRYVTIGRYGPEEVIDRLKSAAEYEMNMSIAQGLSAGGQARIGQASEGIVKPQPVSKRPAAPRRSAANTARDARKAGLIDMQKGRVPFQSYSTAGKVRAAEGISGETHEAAHLVPQAVYRKLGGGEYSAHTVNLPIEIHDLIDQGWLWRWKAAIKNGREVTAGDVEQWVGDAIARIPKDKLVPETKGTLQWKLHHELYSDLGLTPDFVIVPGSR
jgi:hypothetical protein